MAPLEGGFLHVHLLSLSLSLSLSIFNPIRLSTHTQKGLYILALSFFIFTTNTTTNKFLCQVFSLDSFSLLFVCSLGFPCFVALSGVEFCKTNIWSFVHNWLVCSSRSVAFLGFLLGDRKMACAMNAAAMMVGVAPAQAVGAVCGSTSSRSTTASKSSLLFNNGGLHVTKLAHSSRARTMQPLRVRAEDESIVDKVKGGVQDLSQKMKDAMPSGGNREGLSGPKRTDEEGYWFDTPSSTGDVTDKAKQMASKSRTLDGEETESLQERLKDGVRTLRSKTGDVIYDATRNAKDVGNDATQKNIDAQTKYTKGQ